MKPKASQGQSMGYGQSTADQGTTNTLANQVTANNSQYNGPLNQTPFYQAMLKQGTQSTNAAYDNAGRNLKMSMESAGVGGSSGAAQGNNAAMGAQRASALSQVPTQATLSTAGMQQQANSQQAMLAAMYSGAGLGYYGGANTDEQNALARQSSMWNGLLQAGTGVAMAPFQG